MATITATLPTDWVAPIRGVDSQEQFSLKANNAWVKLRREITPQTNLFGEQANSLRDEVNGFREEALASKNSATISATTATTQAGIATSRANEALLSKNSAEASATTATTQANIAKGYADSIEPSTLVKLTGNQTIEDVKTFITSPIVPTPTTDFQVATKQYVDEATNRIGLIDYGYVAKPYHIVAFGGEFNRADYPKLFVYLQNNNSSILVTEANWQSQATANGGICGFFSDGDGTTTFRVPNLDKAFLRPDSRGVGSFQADELKSHNHGITPIAGNRGTTEGNWFGVQHNTKNSTTDSTGGSETRPKNIAVLPLIVAK